MNRIEGLATLRVNPAEEISFTYKGRKYFGKKGDTIATALFANGVRIFGRSLKYHRPRGLYSLDGECSNTTMQVNGVPNVRCENTLLAEGMDVREQNVKGSAKNDMLGFIDKLDWMMPAGFYYNCMHKPARLWPMAMKQIRKAAGLGRMAPDFKMTGAYDEVFLNSDVTVVGGGPAGMNAALAAAEKKLRVVLLESRPFLGGFFDYRTAEYETGIPFHQHAAGLAQKVMENEHIRVFTHASMVGAYSNNLITGFQVGSEDNAFDQRYLEIRSAGVVMATGCIERPLIFDNNERPGVMQVACAHRLAGTYGLLPGTVGVFSIGHDLGLEAAVLLHDLGLEIPCVADIREDGQDPDLVRELESRQIKLLKGWAAAEALGRKKVKGVTLTNINGIASRTIKCDLLVASAGLTPVTGGITVAQGALKYDEHTGYFLPDRLPANTHAAGRMLGFDHGASIEASGRLAGLKAAMDCGKASDTEVSAAADGLRNLPPVPRGTKYVSGPVKGRKSFICFDEDTTIKNINQAIEKGFDVPELIKRFTSAGTGPGQGGIPGHNLPLYVAKYRAESAVLKPTTVRPPLVPTLVAAYAGANHSMFKRTPLHGLQKSDGGVFRNIGVWKRARYFSKDFTCQNEIENVRSNVGMLDASTLGKFRIHGPDALKALQRVYVSDMAKVREGRVKYSAMCNDDGCVIDDGVVVKQGENDFYFTTSTGRAGATVEWIRYHTRYDNWDFHLVNLTDALGVINISGPRAREVLEKIIPDDLSNPAFGFSEYRVFRIQDTVDVRVMRLGFVGELSYELHVPSSFMKSVWLMLKEAGREFGVQNFGVEAQNVLRMEKCHIILGQESEQRTNLLDLGLGFLWDRNKPEVRTVGAVALRQAENDAARFRLVGFKMEENGRAPRDGSLIVDDRIRGYVCTARNSFTLKEAVGMALVESGLSKTGTRLSIFEDECKGVLTHGRVVDMPFYDPEGERMKS